MGYSNTRFGEMKLIALFAFAAIAVAHSAPEDSAVAENFFQSAPQFVETVDLDDDHYMNPENVLAELKTVTADKSWKSVEAEFTQMIQNEDSDTQMATLFSLQKMAKMDPEVLGQLTVEAMDKNKNNELVQAEFWGGRRRRRVFRAVARVARRVVRHVGRAVRHVARHVGNAARAVGGVIVNAVKRLGSWLKALASKLCRKVLRKIVKKVHKYVRKKVVKFCAKLCIKAAAKIYIIGAGSPAAGAVAAAIGAGCTVGGKLAFDALVRYIRHRHMGGAKMDVFVADFICDSVGLKTGQGNSSRRRYRRSHRRSHRRSYRRYRRRL